VEKEAHEEAHEDTLMRRVAGGDRRAFAAIVQAHQTPLVRFAVRLTNDPEAAQDAVQEAFLRLWRGREGFRPCGRLRSYLFQSVRRLCLDHLRAARPWAALDEHLPAAEAGPAETAQSGALADAVARAVLALPEPQRAVFLLSHYAQLSYPEIAEILECPLGTVASRKHSATAALRRRLAPWMETP